MAVCDTFPSWCVWRLADAVITSYESQRSPRSKHFSEHLFIKSNLLGKQLRQNSTVLPPKLMKWFNTAMSARASLTIPRALYIMSRSDRYGLRLCTEKLSFTRPNCAGVKNIEFSRKPVVFPRNHERYRPAVVQKHESASPRAWFNFYFSRHDNSGELVMKKGEFSTRRCCVGEPTQFQSSDASVSVQDVQDKWWCHRL